MRSHNIEFLLIDGDEYYHKMKCSKRDQNILHWK